MTSEIERMADEIACRSDMEVGLRQELKVAALEMARRLLERATGMTIETRFGEIDALNGSKTICVKIIKLADLEKLFEEGEER